MADRHVRTITGDDVVGYYRCIRTGFLIDRSVSDESRDWVVEHEDLSRMWAEFDDGVLCGTAGTFGSKVRAVGGAEVPASCVTWVTVLPTHTRRGHLSRLMAAHHAAAREAGEVVSMLVAAEWPIYGRFGYGPATRFAFWEVDARKAEVPGAPVGTVELLDPADFDGPAAEVLAARHASGRPGSIVRPTLLREDVTGTNVRPGKPATPTRTRVLHRDPDGRPDGYVVYDPTEKWSGMVSTATLAIADLMAANPIAERELWRYLTSIDLVDKITGEIDPATVLPFVLSDGRAARPTGDWDHIWVSLLDISEALTARTYQVTDQLVIDVPITDRTPGGRFLLDAGPDGATCTVTDDDPDITLDASALGSIWLGDTDLRRIAAGPGRVVEHTAGATDRMARLFRHDEVAYCPTDF